MTRKQAVNKCWALINQNLYVEANALMVAQRRVHGHRAFNYWVRLQIANGLWELAG